MMNFPRNSSSSSGPPLHPAAPQQTLTKCLQTHVLSTEQIMAASASALGASMVPVAANGKAQEGQGRLPLAFRGYHLFRGVMLACIPPRYFSQFREHCCSGLLSLGGLLLLVYIGLCMVSAAIDFWIVRASARADMRSRVVSLLRVCDMVILSVCLVGTARGIVSGTYPQLISWTSMPRSMMEFGMFSPLTQGISLFFGVPASSRAMRLSIQGVCWAMSINACFIYGPNSGLHPPKRWVTLGVLHTVAHALIVLITGRWKRLWDLAMPKKAPRRQYVSSRRRRTVCVSVKMLGVHLEDVDPSALQVLRSKLRVIEAHPGSSAVFEGCVQLVFTVDVNEQQSAM